MSQGTWVVTSSLPAAAFLIPAAVGVAVLLGRRLGRGAVQGLSIACAAAMLLIAARMAVLTSGGAVLTAWSNELRVDALAALLVAVISGVGLLATVYATRYVNLEGLTTRWGEEKAQRRLPLFFALLLWFLATMVWGCVTNNIIMLYVAVEATTLTSGFLVAFYWDKRALEAGYKYLMILTISITFALVGCVVTYAGAAATGVLDGGTALLLSEVRRAAPLMPAGTALVAVAFLVVGFGAKAGIAPFHPWLPDAHAEAPAPVSVLMSGVMIKMAAYALTRTVSVFYPSWPQLTIFAVALGVFSIVLGVVVALSQTDLKRMLAYSSVSQMGYVLAGVGLGSYLGCYGGLFHLLNHAVCKSLLFMCAGAVIYATGARHIAELGGLGRRMPVTGACFIVGALAISGLPPFNGFMSKLTVFLALAQAGLWWACLIAVAASVLTMVVLVRAGYRVFWGPPRGADGVQVAEVGAAMRVPMLVLAILCLVLGLAPGLPYPLLDLAAGVLAVMGR